MTQRTDPRTPDALDTPAPPAPATLRETGLKEAAVVDLVLKHLYARGTLGGQQIADAVRLPFPILDDLLLSLQHRRLLEVRGTAGHGRGGYRFELTEAGRTRAREALAASQYIGPAPVPLPLWREWVDRQSARHAHVTRATVADAFPDLVLDEATLDAVGPAMRSARSLFLHGEPGNGKTRIAEGIARLQGGAIHIPYAIDIEGQVVTIFDPVHHREIPEPDGENAGDPLGLLRHQPGHDRRFVRVARPAVTAGGELTLEQLDLRYDPHTRTYQAPFQLKASGGVLVIDDFGRQRVPPRDLLNRWIVPLERGIDFLTLHTGTKFPVPFDCFLILATNLDPADLAEEAFLRRIRYKIHVPSPGPDRYREIFRRCCFERDIPYDPAAVDYLYEAYYRGRSIPPRGCHPRDILDHLVDAARFLETAPVLSRELLDRACAAYFIGATVAA